MSAFTHCRVCDVELPIGRVAKMFISDVERLGELCDECAERVTKFLVTLTKRCAARTRIEEAFANRGSRMPEPKRDGNEITAAEVAIDPTLPTRYAFEYGHAIVLRDDGTVRTVISIPGVDLACALCGC